MAERQRDVGVGQGAVRRGHEGLARDRGQHVQHARIEHVPGSNLLFDHQFAGLGVVDRHGIGPARKPDSLAAGAAFKVILAGAVLSWAGSIAVVAHQYAVPEVTATSVTAGMGSAFGIGAQEHVDSAIQVRIDIDTARLGTQPHIIRL